MSTGGQFVGGVVGAVAGFFLGGGPTGALYGAQIGIMAGGYLDPPKGPTVNGPRLNDLTVQTSTYGAVIPRVYGTCTVNGNVIWLEGNRLKETVTKKKSGGKGGGSKTTTRTYTYSASFAVGLCEGPIVGVRRIWVGPDLIYDAGSSDPDTIAASNAAAEGFAIYLGTNTQSPDPRIQADIGVANCSAWRGLAYIVFYDLALARYANSLMGAPVRVEVFKTGTVSEYPHTYRSTPVSRNYWSTAWSGSIFCAVALGSNVCATSPDGITWTEHTLPTAENWHSIAYGKGLFVITTPSAYCYTSSDGVSWTSRALPYPAGVGNAQVASNGSRFVMVGEYSQFWVSSDGIAWAGVNHYASSWFFNCIAWNPVLGLFAAVQQMGTQILTSSDGLTWEIHETGLSAKNWYRIDVKDGRFLVISSSASNGVLYSDDGDIWTHSNIAGTPSGNSITHDSTNFVAFDNTNFHTSPDGINWTSHSIGGDYWNAACWNGALIVAFDFTHSFYQAITIIPRLVAPGVDTLDNIISSECLESGLLSAGDIDVTALTSQVRGYRIGSIGALRAAIEPLQAAWPFDVVQHGYKVQFVARGGASVVTIPAADLDARAGGAAPGVQITTSREMDSQLARRVTVQHLDYAREYDAGSQYAERLNTPAVNALVLDLPIVMTSAEAAGVAEVLLYVYWLERHDVSFALPPTYNQLEPGDVVTLTTPEGALSLRLTGVTNTSDGRVECQAKYANPAIYTPAALGAAPAVTGSTTIAFPGFSRYVLLDVPAVHSLLEDPGFLAGMSGQKASWTAGVLVRSIDSGVSWSDVQGFVSPGATMGHAVDSIGVVETRLVDKASRLTVSLSHGALYSITELQMLAGGNHFAYGAHGRWEIIAAQTCELQGNGTYILSDFLRGRYGTEWAMGLHAADDTIVLLDTDDLAVIGMSTAQIGLSLLYRGITQGQDISSDTDYAFAYSGVNLECLSPVYFRSRRDPATGDWICDWIRRTRIGGEWRDRVDASLGESTEAYEVDIFADAACSKLRRTLPATSAALTYTAAQQAADFGKLTNDLWCKVYQMSAVAGRGYALAAVGSADSLNGYAATITVPAASVSANLTDFPLFLDLSLMSASWWNSLYYRDGRDIRVANSAGVDIPFDLVAVDAKNRTGYLFTKTSLSSSVATTLTVRAGRSADGFVAPTDSNGRNNVWTNYHRVFTFGHDHADRTGNGYPTAYAPTTSLQVAATSPNTLSHQGVAWDGRYYYVSDTNRLTRYDAAWNVLATNTNPVGDVGGGVNHVGDIEVVDGILYAPVENYVSAAVYSLMRIARFDAETLAHIDTVDISAQGHEAASIAYCAKDGYLYVASFADGSKLWKYNRTTLAYIGSLSLSTTIAYPQGVTWWNEAFWISSGSAAVYRVEYAGTVRGSMYATSVASDVYEGIGHADDGLLLLVDPAASLHNGVVRTLTPKTTGKVASVEMAGNVDQFEFLAGLTRYTTWTMGCSARLDNKTANQGILSYTVNGSSNAADRVTLAYRLSSDRLGLWNDTDTWLLDTISPVVGTVYRLNASHNGTSGRKIYRDGTLTNSAGSSTARPSVSADAIVVGMESWARAEDLSGAVGFAYLAPTQFADAYIAAESANLASPSTFYSISG